MTGSWLSRIASRPMSAVDRLHGRHHLAATAAGFWLSYAGLHVFALRAGLRGPEAWAWPASVDLFILTGELGITVSAIRRQHDWWAWVFLVVGFGPSVLFNVLHVAAVTPAWSPSAVAAVPSVAAMLAALMRQVYRLAARPEPDALHPLAIGNGHAVPEGGREAAEKYAADLARGELPSIRRLQREMHCGQPKAQQMRSYLDLLCRA